jgi:hypothetical protein
MLIEASTKPRNLKRGYKVKKLHKALGFSDEVGLYDCCGRLNLSAEEPNEFAVLTGLLKALMPVKNSRSKITVEIDGEKLFEYSKSARAK